LEKILDSKKINTHKTVKVDSNNAKKHQCEGELLVELVRENIKDGSEFFVCEVGMSGNSFTEYINVFIREKIYGAHFLIEQQKFYDKPNKFPIPNGVEIIDLDDSEKTKKSKFGEIKNEEKMNTDKMETEEETDDFFF